MPPATYDLSPFGMDHFGRAQLKDERRTKSLVDLANRLSRHPGGTLPDKFKDPNALRRCYDLVNTEAVTHPAVLDPHVRRTAELLLDHQGVALCLHDCTELDFTGRDSLADQLGQIGDGFGKGYECHNSLVVLPNGRRVLGLLAQQLHHRDDVPKDETPAQCRERENRESLLWPRGAEAARLAIERACRDKGLDGPPKGLRLVDVFDRGGDTFEFLDHLDLHNRSYVGRAQHNRHVLVGPEGGQEDVKLFDHLRGLPARGRSREVTIRSHDGGPTRKAKVVISWSAVMLVPPQQQCGHSRRIPLAVWVVRVWEPHPPAGEKAVEWFLVTNVAVRKAKDAWERVDWYCLRWVVEEYHKAKKTGCAIELPQFTTIEAMEPMIALLSVVAVGLLNLRTMGRDKDLRDSPATLVVGQEEVDILSGWRHQERRPLTVGEFFLALARLGGHQNRNKDRPPGWLVLWRGWQSLQLLLAGARAARAPAQDPNHNNSHPQGAKK